MRIKNHSQSSEKPKGKKRRNKEYAEKMARVPREESRHYEELFQREVAPYYVEGLCTVSSCEDMEAACMQHNNTAHYCLCTLNGKPASEDSRCPRNTGEVAPYYVEGLCTVSSCEDMEAACMQHNNTAHYCLCTSNGKPASEDSRCPRSTVQRGKPIRNVIPPRMSSSNPGDRNALMSPTLQVGEGGAEGTRGTGGEPKVLGPGMETSTGLLLMALVGGVALLFIVVLAVIWYMRRRVCTVDEKTQPRVRPGEPLLPERYITNPQYGVYGPNPVAVQGPPADDTSEPQVLRLDRNALTLLEVVGEGCFGKVHKGLLKANSGEQVVAIKVLKESASRSAEDDFEKEVNIMSAFRHENILSLIGVVNREDQKASPWMVFEYMEWGDLAGVLRGSRGGGRPGPNLNEPALLHVALQVARGMQYLATRRFVHRDLAARNCLVGCNLAVKIADFGMSRDIYTCDYYKMGGERPMPVRWMSPESIVYARFTHESDVWSFGVVLWEIYSRGKQPFYGHNNDGATRLILLGIHLVPPEDCPPFSGELMRACWETDPRDRISFDEICRKLEIAAGNCVESVQTGLPRPPTSPTPQDSAGYLIPARQPAMDYLKLSLPEPGMEDASSESSEEEEDDEYT